MNRGPNSPKCVTITRPLIGPIGEENAGSNRYRRNLAYLQIHCIDRSGRAGVPSGPHWRPKLFARLEAQKNRDQHPPSRVDGSPYLVEIVGSGAAAQTSESGHQV